MGPAKILRAGGVSAHTCALAWVVVENVEFNLYAMSGLSELSCGVTPPRRYIDDGQGTIGGQPIQKWACGDQPHFPTLHFPFSEVSMNVTIAETTRLADVR